VSRNLADVCHRRKRNRNTAATLQAESGFILEDPSVAAFRQSIIEGHWKQAEEMLPSLPLERAENSTVRANFSSNFLARPRLLTTIGLVV
jgi:hypothetical protein